MRPLPRLLAFADDRIAALDDLGVRAAAIAAAGPAAALVARMPGGTTDQLAAMAQRFVANAAPPMAMVLVTGRADVAMSTGAHGVILRKDDLDVETVRTLCHPERSAPHAPELCHPERSAPQAREVEGPQSSDILVFRSVHTVSEAEAAVRDGANALIAGSIWSSTTHPRREPAGTGFLRQVVALGVPAFAIGGVTAARAGEAHDAGAWGVAAIGAVWDAKSPYQAAMEILEIWTACN